MAFNASLTKNVTTALTTCRTASANGDVVIGLRLTNTTSGTIYVSACVERSGVDYYLVGGVTPATQGAPVPVGSSLVIINGDADKVVLNAGDSIRAISSVATSCDAIVSVLEN